MGASTEHVILNALLVLVSFIGGVLVGVAIRAVSLV